MCGIAGIYALGSQTLPPGAENAVRLALRDLRHRGPDDEGVFVRPGVALGHRRLSIVDIEGGHQPFEYESAKLAMIYNGELYGFDRLRSTLSGRHTFSSRSDTEVLLQILHQRGVDGLRDANGMYAIACFDGANDELMLAIDPVGIKPLYLSVREHWIAFASELGAMCTMREALGERPALSQSALHCYLRYGWVPAPASLIAGVSKLHPGETLRIRRSGIVSRQRVELPAPEPGIPSNLSDRDLAAAVRARLTEAVKDQLVADVPVGLFLSGGIDSSLLLALASREMAGIQTFSIGFRGLSAEQDAYDESAHASRVAQHFGARHHELQLKAGLVFPRIDEIVAGVDEPTSDPAVIPLYFLAELAARSVKVALSGDGGDELFGGYQYHRVRALKARLHSAPAGLDVLARVGLRAARAIVPPRPAAARRLRAALKLLIEPDFVHPLFGASLLPPVEAGLGVRGGGADSLWANPDRLLLAELEGPLAGMMLPKTDRITMMHSLETRVPMLDARMIRFARGLPWEAKVNRGRTKYALRLALAAEVPADIWNRPKKGFRVPLDEWLRKDLRPWIDSQIRGLEALDGALGTIDPRAVLADHLAGRAQNGAPLWALAVLSRWVRRTGGRVSRETIRDLPAGALHSAAGC